MATDRRGRVGIAPVNTAESRDSSHVIYLATTASNAGEMRAAQDSGWKPSGRSTDKRADQSRHRATWVSALDRVESTKRPR
jgi:hypothetical protein